ncbi:hypothetical protein QJS10_CPA02g00078 [Acorus calamus]|uniref:Uncharacterized protein n=1 Tax=Acorus calamus TaxID=4465 RepID=A0AAV9FB50_ACOCL|nr:hypothetical protein QJS10_CPA02g00078 [Acorus calamus]
MADLEREVLEDRGQPNLAPQPLRFQPRIQQCPLLRFRSRVRPELFERSDLRPPHQGHHHSRRSGLQRNCVCVWANQQWKNVYHEWF